MLEFTPVMAAPMRGGCRRCEEAVGFRPTIIKLASRQGQIPFEKFTCPRRGRNALNVCE
jgi:hypothetical protein